MTLAYVPPSFLLYIYLSKLSSFGMNLLKFSCENFILQTKEPLAFSRFCIYVFYGTWQCGVSYGVPTVWERISYHNLPFISLEM